VTANNLPARWRFFIGGSMAQSREDKIYLAYKGVKSKIEKQGLDREHARALLLIAEAFNISPLKVDQIIRSKKK
jgi:hypothetical protein